MSNRLIILTINTTLTFREGSKITLLPMATEEVQYRVCYLILRVIFAQIFEVCHVTSVLHFLTFQVPPAATD